MATLRNSLLVSFLDKYATTAIHFVSGMIIARLLTPEEIGIFSVGAVIVSFAHVFRDAGVTNYLIQESELNPKRLRTAFTVTLAAAWLLAACLAAVANTAGNIYAEPGVTQVVLVLALTFVLLPFGSPAIALLRREMRFSILLRINVASALVQAATSILLAALGHGFLSLAWGALTGAGTTILVAAWHSPSAVAFLPSFSAWRRVLSFSGYSSLSTLLVQFGIQGPDLIVGRVLGFADLGILSRANGLAFTFGQIFSAAVDPVALPAISKRHRDGTDLRADLLRAYSYYTAFAWPLLAIMAFLADPIILILYGPQWVAAAPLLQILCVALSIRQLSALGTFVLVGTGRVKANFRAQLLLQPARVIAVIPASLVGLEAVAWTQVLFYLATLLIYQRLAHLPLGLTLTAQLAACAKSVCITAIVLIGMTAASAEFGNSSDSLPISTAFVGCAALALWGLGFYVCRHPFRVEVSRALRKVTRLLVAAH